MIDATAPANDIIQELRLRRWARENYLPRSLRPQTLHQVVLDEMQARDAELQFAEANRGFSIAQYVPLPPQGIRRVDPAELQLNPPHFPLTEQEARTREDIFADYLG